MNKYAGQSLAIVFALLIVGSIIGFAMYARMVSDSERIVEERASGEANELVETTIGLISTLDYEQIKDEEVLTEINECNEMDLYEDSGCRAYNLSLNDMEDILVTMGLEESELEMLSSFKHDLDEETTEDYCTTELSVRSLTAEGVNIPKDDVYSVFLQEAQDLDNCIIEFELRGLEDADGFIMSTFYTENDEDNEILSYKPYDFEDTIGFTYNGGDSNNWRGYQTGTKIIFSSESIYPVEKDLDDTVYSLNEIRFKSLGGESNLKWRPGEGSSCNLDAHLNIEVGATCGGNYVGKSFTLPQGYFAPPMFDYVYFQGEGGLN